MSLTTKLIPVNGYDMTGLRVWLEQMAEQGLQYVYAIGPIAQFRRTDRKAIKIHLEPARKGTEKEQRDVSELYAEAGWTCWGSFKSTFYVFATEEQEAVSHTQPEVLEYALRKLCRQLYVRCSVALIAFVGLTWWLWKEFADVFLGLEFRSSPLYILMTTGKPYWLLPLLPALFLLVCSMMRGIPNVYRAIFLLHSGERETDATVLRGGGWLKAACLCLVLVPLFWGFQVRYEGSAELDELNRSASYVRLEELETGAGFSASDFINRNFAGIRSHILIPVQYNSHEWGGYYVTEYTEKLESGVVVTTYSSQPYYLKTHFLRCRTRSLAERIFWEQDHWFYFQNGTQMSYPGFDELIVNLERSGENIGLDSGVSLRVEGSETNIPIDLTVKDLNRWNLYGRAGEKVLFVEYRGSGDLRDFLPRFAEMMELLGT